MDSPNISMRIRRHESLPCPTLHHPSIAKVAEARRGNRTSGTTSVLIGRRLGATKNNPYVGSFRHAPPTSLRSMAASSLPSLSSRKEMASSSSASVLFSPSFSVAKSSPYVGWFHHAPPAFSSFHVLGSATTAMKNKKNKTENKHSRTKPTRKSSVIQHKVDLDSLLELDRWHHQLTSLLLGMSNEYSEKNPPLLLRQIINGRLLGGSREDGMRMGGNRKSAENSIIHQCNSMYQPHVSRMSSLSSSETLPLTVLSRLTSWLLFPLLFSDDECFDDFGCLNGNYSSKYTSIGLKFFPTRPADERSIEIDSEEDDDDDDDDYSSASSVDYDPVGESSIRDSISPETEREFSTEANLSVSEIAEAYYAHQLLDESRRRSNSDATTTSQQSGLSDPSSLHHNTDFATEETRQRLDYEITQMDIARMTRNASRHLDVDSILKLPTIVYRKPRSSPKTCRKKQTPPQSEQSYHHICTPIHEDRSDSSSQGSLINVEDMDNDETILSEDGWSFMMVSGMKPPTIDTSVDNCRSSCCNFDSSINRYGVRSTDDMCVICQEAFLDGDRLRVLPCDHSFHVGCIDRWLSGSHSHNECFTTGCPTCKKQPALQSPSSLLQIPALEMSMTEEGDTSGSLPSWAFANLGSVLAMSSGDF